MRGYQKVIPTATVLTVFLTLCGCGDPSGTISQVRYKYTHASIAESTSVTAKLPDHYSSSVGIGDLDTWVNGKWGKPTGVVTTGTSGTETLTYANGFTVFFTHHRISSIVENFQVPISIGKALADVKESIPVDSALVTHHLAGPNDAQALYQYQSKALAKLVTNQVWPDNPYQVAGTVYVTMQMNGDKVAGVTIGIESPQIV